MKKQRVTTVCAADVIALATEVLAKDGVFWFRSRGFSMEPFIGDGELVALQKVRVDDIQPGDVLLCNLLEKPILHRVSRTTAGKAAQFVMASDVGDQIHPATAEQVVGRLAAVKQSPARLVKWHTRRAGKLALSMLAPDLAASCRQLIRRFI